MKKISTNERGAGGQVIVGVLLLLVLLSILVPLMVLYTQHESRWTEKEHQSTLAFHLAEAGIEKGYLALTTSTSTWSNLVNLGTLLAGFQFDTSYSDVEGGTYTVSITSGPQKQQATIISVGRDKKRKELRAIKAIYANAPLGNVALRGRSTASISGSNTSVEWGAVMTRKALTVNGRAHPQFWSASSIDLDSNGATPPNCDAPNCWQWHSYQNNLPPEPDIPLATYKASATATSTYYSGNQSWGGGACSAICNDGTSCATGKTYYVEGNLTVCTSGIYVQGSLIVTGDLNLPNGRSGQGGPTVNFPQKSWMQYGNDWSFYVSQLWDPTAPAAFPGLNSSYLSPSTTTYTFSDNKVLVYGFLYVGGNLNQSGGAGQTKVVGAIYVVGNITLGANNIFVYYNEDAASSILTNNIILSRVSWQDIVYGSWPGP